MAEEVTARAPEHARPRLLRQDWHDLSFIHWAVEPAEVAHYFPPGTQPDTFPETNIRLYSVDTTGRRGVVFLSLDATRLALVAGARSALGIPYRWARMEHQRQGNQHTYSTSAVRWPRINASSMIQTRVGEQLEPGPLEHFLTARWGLHLSRGGRTWYMPNEHPPWILHRAELLAFVDQGLLASVGLGELSERQPDHVAFSAGVPAVFGPPRRPVPR
jgi:uncharacterized protein YqjF (DUF2071 family)